MPAEIDKDQLNELRRQLRQICRAQDPGEKNPETGEMIKKIKNARTLARLQVLAEEIGSAETAAAYPRPAQPRREPERPEMAEPKIVPAITAGLRPLTHAEQRRPRRSFASHRAEAEIPSLIRLLKKSYEDFLQENAAPAERAMQGLENAFRKVFPIESSSGAVILHFKEYSLQPPKYTVPECRLRGLTYQSSVYARIDMEIYEKKGGAVKEVKEENVYMGELPLMTSDGSFVINGTERVVVSQLHRSPGVLFEHDSGRNAGGGKYIYSARIIPYFGSWLDFEFDKRDLLYFRIDRKRKMPATILLKAMGYGKARILREFYEFEDFRLRPEGKVDYKIRAKFLHNVALPFDLRVKGKTAVAKLQRVKKSDLRKIAPLEGAYHPAGGEEFLYGRRLALDVFTEDGEEIAKANAEIDKNILELLRIAEIHDIQTLYVNEFDHGPFIAQTLAQDEKLDEEKSRETIYRMLRPGDPPNREVVNNYLDTIFYDSSSYSLSHVGRMKFNRRLRPGRPAMEYKVLLGPEAPRLNKAAAAAAADALVQSGAFANMEDAAEFLAYAKQFNAKRPIAENLAREEAEKLAASLKSAVGAHAVEQTTLSRDDILTAVKYLVDLRNGKQKVDDIDNLSNRRVRAVGEFIENQFYLGLQRVNRAIRDRLSRAETDNLMPHNLISAKAISSSVSEFFNGNQLSQFMDQTNPIAEITHKRRVSAFGAGGLNRDRVGFEVRDVHPSHYGRICPIETPEGPNIGLINSMSLYAEADQYGFLRTPYVKVDNGAATGEVARLSAIDEQGRAIAQAGGKRGKDGRFLDSMVSARRDGEIILCRPEELDYVDIAPSQIASVAASLIPFLEHDDANRALMGSNMQRQAVPCMHPEKPLVGTGMERHAVAGMGSVVQARRGGIVSFVDANRVAVRVAENEIVPGESGVDIYNLLRHTRSNQNTDISHRPIVREGDRIAADDVIADGSATDLGEVALGQNMLVAFLPWNGYNFEDSILISERVVADQRYTSIHIIEEVAHARSTQLGDEEITRDIPHQSEASLMNLDEEGIVNVGVHVKPGDILVGKITPKGERQLTPEEKLLRAVFGEKAADVKDTSLRMPPGSAGIVIDVKVFDSDEIKKRDLRDSSAGRRMESIQEMELEEFKRGQEKAREIMEDDASERIRALVAGRVAAVSAGAVKKDAVITEEKLDELKPAQWTKLRVVERVADGGINDKIKALDALLKNENKRREEEMKAQERKIKEGHLLPHGILKTIKVYVAIRRNLQAGDKMAGRHGNKGVVSKVVPAESMPYLEDGTPVDVVLSPLGVPSRMNVGQILETHLGLAARRLGEKISELSRREREKQTGELRAFLQKVYDGDGRGFDPAKLSDAEILTAADNLKKGVPFATPIFDGASEDDIRRMLKLGGLPSSGQMALYDGHSGERFERPVTVGYMYILKLHHLVDEKMHSRSTGPYSLITQQPLGGKAQRGGQRFGEMEVWALEAYGAAYTLCEMLTVKSDDIYWRTKMFEGISEGDLQLKTGIPESFNVLVQEIRALGIDMDFE
ncbi:MAG: DNA-directed RNA polymerase subunit beta [Gammaproteobacteria bacterium]